MGAIEEKKIEELAALTLLIDRIAKQNEQVGFDIKKDFPQLIWILRDFTLDLDTNTAQDYLDKCLTEVSTLNIENEKGLAEVKNKNKMRKLIKNYFRSRTCLTFGRPINDEKALQNLDQENLIKKEFKNDVDNLMNLITLSVVPKSANKSYLSGKLFFNYLDSLIKAINTGEVPMLNSSIERLLSAEAQEKTARIIAEASQALESLKSKLPLGETELAHRYTETIFEYIEVLREQISYIATKETYSKNLKQLLKASKDKFEEIEAENLAISAKNTTELVTSFTAALPKQGSSISEAGLGGDISSLKSVYSAYFATSQSSTKLDYFKISQFVIDSLFEQFEKVTENHKRRFQDQQSKIDDLNKSLKDREKMLKDRISELEQFIKEIDREAKIAKERVVEEKDNKQKDMEAKDIEIRNLKDRLTRATEKLEKEKESQSAYKQKINKLEGELIQTEDKINTKDLEMHELMSKIKDTEKNITIHAEKLSKDGNLVSDQNSAHVFDLIKELSYNVEMLNVEIRAKNQFKITSLAKKVAYCSLPLARCERS